jgi:hypothetical protein
MSEQVLLVLDRVSGRWGLAHATVGSLTCRAGRHLTGTAQGTVAADRILDIEASVPTDTRREISNATRE